MEGRDGKERAEPQQAFGVAHRPSEWEEASFEGVIVLSPFQARYFFAR